VSSFVVLTVAPTIAPPDASEICPWIVLVAWAKIKQGIPRIRRASHKPNLEAENWAWICEGWAFEIILFSLVLC
jgi:hypothetical protein